ncbi:hypothetical protein A2U01_0072104, partial [Trifolium medium]|nr:hypothetical protein [Trifolium medium]
MEENQPPVEGSEKGKNDKKKDKNHKERKQKKDQEDTAITEAGKQSEQPISLEDKYVEKKKRKKKHKKTHSTSDRSIADTSIPTNEEEELPKNLDT